MTTERERGDFKTRFSSDRQPVKNGRSREARDRISGKFLKELADHFEENGRAAIERIYKDHPVSYLGAVAALIPREIEITRPLDGMDESALTKAIEVLTDLLRSQAPQERTNEDSAPLSVN